MTTTKLTTKICPVCKEEKALEMFSICRSNNDGRQYRCKDCGTLYAKGQTEKRKQSGWQKTYDRNRNLSRYGLSMESYEEILVAQNYCCASCGRHISELSQKLTVDHDHKCCPGKKMSCGKCVRGLLCTNCNVCLGQVNDDIERLMQLAAYLIKFEGVDRVGIS